MFEAIFTSTALQYYGIALPFSLARPGIKVAIPNPKTVSSGVYAVELLEAASMSLKVKPNIVTYSESYEKALNLLALKAVDAVIGWRQIPRRSSGKIEAINLKPGEIPRVAYISAAAISYTRHREEALEFLEFLKSNQAKAIFRKHGFPTGEAEIRKIAPGSLVGGIYKLPHGW